MGDRDGHRHAPLVREVHGAPVRDVRDREGHEVIERLADVQGSREHLARLREERGAFAGATLGVVPAGARERPGGELHERRHGPPPLGPDGRFLTEGQRERREDLPVLHEGHGGHGAGVGVQEPAHVGVVTLRLRARREHRAPLVDGGRDGVAASGGLLPPRELRVVRVAGRAEHEEGVRVRAPHDRAREGARERHDPLEDHALDVLGGEGPGERRADVEHRVAREVLAQDARRFVEGAGHDRIVARNVGPVGTFGRTLKAPRPAWADHRNAPTRYGGVQEDEMRSDIVPGGLFPDYELPDHTGVPRRLSFLQGDDPMVLMLGRGVYCPKDRQQLLALAAFHPQLQVGFTQLVTITTDNLILSNDLRLGVGANWPFLHDTERVIANDLGILEYTDRHNNPMIPHTFVLEPGLRIYSVYNGYWYWGRPSTADLHRDLREVTRRVRPDYAIDSPEMRERFERGDREGFYPYGKTMRQVFARMAGAVDQYEKES